MNIFSYLFAIAAGVANPAQAGANAELNQGLGTPLWTALFVYASGFAGAFFLQLVVREGFPGNRIAQTNIPWWAWAGGLLSIASTMTGLTLAQKMGSGVFTGLSLTASLLSSVVLDHFGLMGFKTHPVSPMRAVGSGLLVCGIWLIAKF